MHVKNLKAQQSEATRAALVETARELFATKGYAATSTEDIVRTTGVTRGALYHHFRDKDDLFRAVCIALDGKILERVSAAAMAADGGIWEHLRAGMNEWLDACTEPEVQRVLLLDAPAVLGDVWDQEPGNAALGQVRKVLERAIEEDVLDKQPVEPLARMLLGALREAGLVVARAEDVTIARAEVGESLGRLLEGLRK
jgi:AcrR family transcriptional regulator